MEEDENLEDMQEGEVSLEPLLSDTINEQKVLVIYLTFMKVK